MLSNLVRKSRFLVGKQPLISSSLRGAYTYNGDINDRRPGWHPRPDWDDELQGKYPGPNVPADYQNSWVYKHMTSIKDVSKEPLGGPDPSMPKNSTQFLKGFLLFAGLIATMKATQARS